jgi:hypothetical protein
MKSNDWERDLSAAKLLPQTELLNHSFVAIRSRALEVIEQFPPPSNHLEQSAAGGMILDVALEVFGELIDPLGQQGDLHIRASRIFFVHPKRRKVLGICHSV